MLGLKQCEKVLICLALNPFLTQKRHQLIIFQTLTNKRNTCTYSRILHPSLWVVYKISMDREIKNWQQYQNYRAMLGYDMDNSKRRFWDKKLEMNFIECDILGCSFVFWVKELIRKYEFVPRNITKHILLIKIMCTSYSSIEKDWVYGTSVDITQTFDAYHYHQITAMRSHNFRDRGLPFIYYALEKPGWFTIHTTFAHRHDELNHCNTFIWTVINIDLVEWPSWHMHHSHSPYFTSKASNQ